MRATTTSRLLAACLALCAWVPLQSHAGLLDDDEARKAILDLRAKVSALETNLKTAIDTKADKNVSVDMVNQHEQTMREIAGLRGQIEVLANEVANAQKRQQDFYTDLDTRMRKLEPRQVTIDGKEAAVDPSEQKAYDASMQLLRSGDYKAASQSLSDFVRRYPSSGYAANAQYSLGSAYFAQSDYKNAIAAQEVVAMNYKDSPKAPDALLNIATSYKLLKDKKNEKKALQSLMSQYPDSSAAQAAKDRLAALK